MFFVLIRRVAVFFFSECCGALEYYDKVFDRVITRSEKFLRSIKRIFYIVIIIDDFVIRKVRGFCCFCIFVRKVIGFYSCGFRKNGGRGNICESFGF